MRRILFIAIASIFGVIILISIVHYTPFLSSIDRAVMFIARPVVSPLYRFEESIAGFFGSFGKQGQLLAERDTLASRVAEMEATVARLENVQNENVLLRKQLSFTEDTKYPFVVARPITRVREGDRVFVIINQGEKSGIKVGMPALSPEGALVGKVVKVTASNAFLQILTDTSSVFAGVVARNEAAKGLVRGDHNLSIKMDMIPIDQNIVVGDLVVTAGVEVEVPRGILIGTINNVIETPGAILKSAYITPAADLSNMHLLTILKIHP